MLKVSLRLTSPTPSWDEPWSFTPVSTILAKGVTNSVVQQGMLVPELPAELLHSSVGHTLEIRPRLALGSQAIRN